MTTVKASKTNKTKIEIVTHIYVTHIIKNSTTLYKMDNNTLHIDGKKFNELPHLKFSRNFVCVIETAFLRVSS